MTRKDSLSFIYNIDVVEKNKLIKTIDEKYFNEFCSIGL